MTGSYNPELMKSIMGGPARKMQIKRPAGDGNAGPAQKPAAKAAASPQGAKTAGTDTARQRISVALSVEAIDYLRNLIDEARARGEKATYIDFISLAVEAYREALHSGKVQPWSKPGKSGLGRPKLYGHGDRQIHMRYDQDLMDGIMDLASIMHTRSASPVVRLAVDYWRGALK